MSDQTLLVVLDPNKNIVAVADPAKAPRGMSYSIASKKAHTVHEVQVPGNLMQRPHPEMKRVITERIRASKRD